eukprot:7019347-Ditylum_brightwellii.AAC.1
MHGNQTVPHFELCLDDVAKHVFQEKAGQTQNYLKDFPAHNRNLIHPLDADELLDILEYGVPAKWHRELTVQGFDQVDQGLQKFVEFCNRLELCKPSKGKPKGENPSKPKTVGKHKAKVLTTPTTPA